MKEKVVERTATTRETLWVAKDGSEFTDKTECAKYEKAAVAAIRGAFMTHKKLSKTSAETFMDTVGGCNYESDIYAIEIDSVQTLMVVNMFLDYYGNKTKLGADAIGTVQLIEQTPVDYGGDVYLLGSTEAYKISMCEYIDSLITWNNKEDK